MADNFVTDPGVGGVTFASDERAADSVHFPLTKLVFGALNTFTIVDDSTGNRVPVKVGDPLPAGTNNIGDVDVLTVPTDPFGANADAASDTGSISAKLRFLTDSVLVDDNAFTPAATKITMAGFFADETATDSVDEGDGGVARMTLDRKQIVTVQPHTQGGLSIFRSLDLDETEEDVKTAAGQVYACWATNHASSTRWLKFYNATAASVTVGATTPVITVALPAQSSQDVLAILSAGGHGIAFDTAICVAATTGLADNDTGAPGANEVIVNIFYK